MIPGVDVEEWFRQCTEFAVFGFASLLFLKLLSPSKLYSNFVRVFQRLELGRGWMHTRTTNCTVGHCEFDGFCWVSLVRSAGMSCAVTTTWFQLASALAPQCSVMNVVIGLSDLNCFATGRLPGTKKTCISAGMGSRGRYAVSLVPLLNLA